MKNSALGIAFIFLLVAFVALLYLRQEGSEPETAVQAVGTEAPAAAPETPVIQHPLPVPASPADSTAGRLPPLKESDPTVETAVQELLGEEDLYRLLRVDQLIRRIVVTIDNLPRRTLPAQYLPLTRAEGDLRVQREGEAIVLAPENYRRYRPFVRLAERVDPQQLVSVYLRFYPLFQEAYRELGYPKGYFNDRLVAVLDHLIEAPPVEEPVQLVQPVASYKFADPALEELSAGRKILIRIGPENAARMQSKLEAIRTELVQREKPME